MGWDELTRLQRTPSQCKVTPGFPCPPSPPTAQTSEGEEPQIPLRVEVVPEGTARHVPSMGFGDSGEGLVAATSFSAVPADGEQENIQAATRASCEVARSGCDICSVGLQGRDDTTFDVALQVTNLPLASAITDKCHRASTWMPRMRVRLCYANGTGVMHGSPCIRRSPLRVFLKL